MSRLVVAALLLFATPSFAQEVTPRIVNGTMTSSFPSTGALLIYDDTTQTELTGLCSGTLVGCRTFVTAAHCVCLDQDDAATCNANGGPVAAGRLRVFFQQAGFARVTAVAFHPDFVFGEAGDIAALTLDQEVDGVIPSAINTTQKPTIGTGGTIVGFGRTLNHSNMRSDAGIKREGKVTVADCNRLVPNNTHVCWQFLGTDSSTCSGDSGGPLFIDFGDGPVLAGVTSGGNTTTCDAPDRSFDTDVFVYANWIGERLDAADDTCSSRTLTNVPSVELLSTDGTLSGATGAARFDLTVPADTTMLRITLNGQLSGADFDLYVRAGSEPTVSSYDCADFNPLSFAVCDIEAPVTGTWNVLVQRALGSGAFQLNATALVATAPSACSGDCDGDGVVTVQDIITGVNVALGHAPTSMCPTMDTNGDGTISVEELVAAVASALSGCS